MTYTEKQMDLFDMPHGWVFAHCISADFALGAGIAVEFNKRYNMREKLKSLESNYHINGSFDKAVLIENVFNLITKERCFQKPTLFSLEQALCHMADLVEEYKITKIAMPKIGCGLDGLDWNIVSDMIQEIFEDFDIDIVICYLD